MKKAVAGLLVSINGLTLIAQPSLPQREQKEFEGVVQYKVEVKSKSGVSDNVMKTILAMGDNMTIYIKKGNAKQSTTAADLYFIAARQIAYFKFKKVDTLYYLDYSSDTSALISVTKEKEQKNIAGFACNQLTIKSTSGTKKYFYATALYLNPEYDKNNKLNNYNAFVKETESVWLGYNEETETYNLSHTATKVEQKPLDDNVFELPKLPEKIFSYETAVKNPEFARPGGFSKYLEKNVDGSLGAVYIKIPKGEKTVQQTVYVSFMVTEYGEVQNVKVENKKEVHSRLAEEAVRVVSTSGRWRPATIYGEKISYYLKVPITFNVSKD